MLMRTQGGGRAWRDSNPRPTVIALPILWRLQLRINGTDAAALS